MALHTLSLFTGYGGIELGLSIVGGFRTVCYVERESYAASVIVARIQDKTLDDAPVWDDVTTFDGKPWRGKVDCITGGYPCQPFSVAGKRLGEADERYLWNDVARVIREVEAPLVFLENVPAHLANGFERVRGELRAMGYRVEAGLFSAAEIGAPQKRQRLFVLGYTCGDRLQGRDAEPEQAQSERRHRGLGNTASVYCSTSESSIRTKPTESEFEFDGLFPPRPNEYDRWSEVDAALKPAVCRVADGASKWADRLRMCGNGVHPVVAAVAFISLWGRING